MRTKLLNTLLLAFISMSLSAQTEECATMKNLQQQNLQNPTLKVKMDSIELQTQQWIKNNSYNKSSNNNYNPNKSTNEKNDGNNSVMSLCGYDNTLFTTIAAPTILNQIVSPSPNCTYGGEYVRVTGLVAGRVYRISTCGVNNFDTQISIYTAGGGLAVAHNDDWCGSQSEIYFNPLTSGSYDILIDQYNCVTNTLCASLAVELWYTPRPVITIPVVVHVIHFGEPIGTGRNLSVAQIQSQIDVLNEDFRRLNSDIITVAAAFRGASDDPLVEFCLAVQDEFGNPTTGIDRWLGTQSSWDVATIETDIKPISIWDRNKYLNLWTLEFGGSDIGTLGYAQFPGGLANTDGIVMLYNAFGRVGNLQPNYALGRTCTHEVGHWLNLKHIWGDESACAQDDFCNDTPLQTVSSSGCQTFPVTDACSPSYPGVMFMNYMDYGYHQCRRMYTFDQASRIDATLFGSRLSLQTSPGCNFTTGTQENILNSSITVFPNPSTGIFSILMNDQLKGSELKITNVIGAIIFISKISETMEIVNLSKFTNGVYFITITSPYGVVSKKLVLEN